MNEKNSTTSEPDFIVRDCGTIVTFRPVSDAAKEWFAEHVQAEAWQMFGNSLAVDHRPAQNLLDGILSEGFTIGRG